MMLFPEGIRTFAAGHFLFTRILHPGHNNCILSSTAVTTARGIYDIGIPVSIVRSEGI